MFIFCPRKHSHSIFKKLTLVLAEIGSDESEEEFAIGECTDNEGGQDGISMIMKMHYGRDAGNWSLYQLQ